MIRKTLDYELEVITFRGTIKEKLKFIMDWIE